MRFASTAPDWSVTCCPSAAIGRPPVARRPRLVRTGIDQAAKNECVGHRNRADSRDDREMFFTRHILAVTKDRILIKVHATSQIHDQFGIASASYFFESSSKSFFTKRSTSVVFHPVEIENQRSMTSINSICSNEECGFYVRSQSFISESIIRKEQFCWNI